MFNNIFQIFHFSPTIFLDSSKCTGPRPSHHGGFVTTARLLSEQSWSCLVFAEALQAEDATLDGVPWEGWEENLQVHGSSSCSAIDFSFFERPPFGLLTNKDGI